MPPKRMPDVRYAANPLDYRKVIVPRSFEKDYRPKDPRVIMPRMRQVVAFNNNRYRFAAPVGESIPLPLLH